MRGNAMCYMIGIIGDKHVSYIPVDINVYNKYKGIKRKSELSDMVGLETSRKWIYEGIAEKSVRW